MRPNLKTVVGSFKTESAEEDNGYKFNIGAPSDTMVFQLKYK